MDNLKITGFSIEKQRFTIAFSIEKQQVFY
jgi:hypothetical protein